MTATVRTTAPTRASWVGRVVLGAVLVALFVVGGTAFRVWEVARQDDRQPARRRRRARRRAVRRPAQLDLRRPPEARGGALRRQARPAHRHHRRRPPRRRLHRGRGGSPLPDQARGAAVGRHRRARRHRHAGQPAGRRRPGRAGRVEPGADRLRPVALAARPADGARQRADGVDVADALRPGRPDPGDPGPLHRPRDRRDAVLPAHPRVGGHRDLRLWGELHRTRPGPPRPRAAEAPRAAGRAQPVLPRPRPRAALRGAAPAGGQDPGRRAGGGRRGQRRAAHPAHPLAGGGPDRPRDRRGPRAATPTWSTPPGWPTTSATRRSGTTGSARLDECGPACGGFEGNAQTLRDAHPARAQGDRRAAQRGLNLTRATPGRRDASTRGRARPGERKYGVYADDAAVFAWVRAGAPEGRRCLEAQVMDWADDVAYSVHDVEDGVLAGRIDLAALATRGRARRARRPRRAPLRGEPGRARRRGAATCWALPVVAAVATVGVPRWLASRAQAPDQRARGPVRRAATDATRAAHGDGPLRRYAADLVVPRGVGPRARCSRRWRCVT